MSAEISFGFLVFSTNQLWIGKNIYASKAAKNKANKYGLIMKNDKINNSTNKVTKIGVLYLCLIRV